MSNTLRRVENETKQLGRGSARERNRLDWKGSQKNCVTNLVKKARYSQLKIQNYIPVILPHKQILQSTQESCVIANGRGGVHETLEMWSTL